MHSVSTILELQIKAMTIMHCVSSRKERSVQLTQLSSFNAAYASMINCRKSRD